MTESHLPLWLSNNKQKGSKIISRITLSQPSLIIALELGCLGATYRHVNHL
uniref:Uncharacterized protein n=1 Tax=Nelumbo nucifera TaxID=4432 RepID=A0A822ZC38_NELNU|nr:TPA_asm: hypothetical protein HUJ06_015574 [Nelumbo nucifera]